MLETGTLFDGRYKIEATLGTGGFGVVYKALETALNRPVALKVLTRWSDRSISEGSLTRFQREAQSLCQIEHVNILKVYRYGIDNDKMPFIVMEYFDGETLRSLLNRLGGLDYKLAFKIATQLAEALQHSHAQGIVHRDLKPENVLLALNDKGGAMVKLIDFGLCKPEIEGKTTGAATLTGTGEVLGSPDYMSPEQALGHKLDKRTDVFSFAIILFELIAGRQPQKANSTAELLMMRISTRIPELLKLDPKCPLSPEVDSLIQACTALKPEGRFDDFEQVLQELRAITPGLPPGNFSYDTSALMPNFSKPRLLVFVAIIAIAMIATGNYLLKADPLARKIITESARWKEEASAEEKEIRSSMDGLSGKSHVKSP